MTLWSKQVLSQIAAVFILLINLPRWNLCYWNNQLIISYRHEDAGQNKKRKLTPKTGTSHIPGTAQRTLPVDVVGWPDDVPFRNYGDLTAAQRQRIRENLATIHFRRRVDILESDRHEAIVADADVAGEVE
jgi:hypothetical protein